MSAFCFYKNHICNYVCLDTSDHFSVLPSKIFFIFSSTLILTSSIDIVFILSSTIFKELKGKHIGAISWCFVHCQQPPIDSVITHCVRVTHICVDSLTIIGSDDLSPGWRQAIIWTNPGLLSIETLGTNFSEILIKIQNFSFMKMHLKISSGKWRPSCLSLNVFMSASVSTRDSTIHTGPPTYSQPIPPARLF